MKKNCLKKLMSVIMLLSMVVVLQYDVSAGTTISKPQKKDPNAAVHYKGSFTYYNYDHQSWNSIDGTLLYSYQAKKSAKYYKPIFYLSTVWMSNNGKDITVTIGEEYSKSVTKIVESTLGVKTTKDLVEFATSVSKSYSTTAAYACSYSTKYTFDMSQYSKKHKYRPAAFGKIMEYWIRKTNRITGNDKTVGDGYTFNEKSGCDLKLAWKN